MKETVDDLVGRGGIAPLMATCLFLAAAGASAQSFESVFGPAATSEQGARRVTPVQTCPGGGVIAVGTTPVAGTPTSNVHVVRTRLDGAPMFERTYDLGPNTIDQGQALAEASDGSGFIITGTTRIFAAGGTDDVLLLKITCGGAPLWASSYGSVRPDSGLDVIEARTGNLVLGTRRGDIVVAGFTINPAGNRDGVLLRTRSDGTLIWNRRYEALGAQEIFRALTETLPTPFGGSPTGDIVAVGQFAQPGDAVRGYVVRVNGDNGAIGAAPQGAVRYGLVDPVVFESVVELRTPGFTGSLVMAGNTRSAATNSDVLLVRTSANPAVVFAERRIGEPAAGAFGEEVALDLREVRNPLPAASVGSLALTGRVGRLGTTAFDAFLLVADRASLKPLAPGQLFGDHAGRLDSGVSVADHARGFVLAGFSSSDFEGVGDPRDLYLIGTDPSGRTNCSREWDPPSEVVQIPPDRITPEGLPFLQRVLRTVQVQALSTAFQECRP